MVAQNLSQLFPKELRLVRLGTCYDCVGRRLMLNTRAFDLEHIPPNKFVFDPGLGSIDFTANSSSSSKVLEDYLGLDVNGKLGFTMCKASANFNMSVASATREDHQKICGYLSYRISGASITLQKSIPPIQYKWMSEEFQYMYDKLMKAPATEKLKHYVEFTKMFGYGVVTHIDLVSGAYGKFEISSDDDASSNEAKYGASATVGISGATKSLGLSAAAEWGKKSQEANRTASLSAHADWYPSTSPAKEWAVAVYELANEYGMSILTEKAKLQDLPTPREAKAPKFPEFKRPDETNIPKDENENEDDELRAMLDVLRQQDGDKAASMTNEQWQASIQELKDLFKVKDVVEEAEKISSDATSRKEISEETSKRRFFNGNHGDSVPRTRRSEKSSLGGGATHEADLGEYIPCGFKITPWIELFPALKLKILPTYNALNMAKVTVFYYTRLQFGQYLHFLSGLPSWLTEHEALDRDVWAYNQICEKFIREAQDKMSDGPFVTSKYVDVICSFEDMWWDKYESGYFTRIRDLYRSFFAHYAFFQEIAYGVVPHFQQAWPSAQLADAIVYPAEWSLPGMERDSRYADCLVPNYSQGRGQGVVTMRDKLAQAVRLYPVYNVNGRWNLAAYYDGEWRHRLHIFPLEGAGTLRNGDRYIPGWSTISPRFSWPTLEAMQQAMDGPYLTQISGEQRYGDRTIAGTASYEVTLQKISHDAVPPDGRFTLRGRPMFADYDHTASLSLLG